MPFGMGKRPLPPIKQKSDSKVFLVEESFEDDGWSTSSSRSLSLTSLERQWLKEENRNWVFQVLVYQNRHRSPIIACIIHPCHKLFINKYTHLDDLNDVTICFCMSQNPHLLDLFLHQGRIPKHVWYEHETGRLSPDIINTLRKTR